MELVFSLLDPAVPQHMRSNDHVTGSPGLHSCNEGLNVIKAVSSSILHGTRVDWKRWLLHAIANCWKKPVFNKVPLEFGGLPEPERSIL